MLWFRDQLCVAMQFLQVLSVLSVFSAVFGLEVNVHQEVKNVVQKFLGAGDMRFKTFTVALQLAIDRKAKTFIETGTSRALPGRCASDGCSTYIFNAFNHYLNDESVEMYSVDISEENCHVSRENIKGLGNPRVEVVASDSVKFIQDWPVDKKIDFLYLDSFDFNPGQEIASQEHHFKELKAALNKIHDETIIFMDDCRLRMGGKCAMVRDYLLKNNWQIVIDEYQTVFVKN